MKKPVVVLNDAGPAVEDMVREIGDLPGIAVTSSSPSFIDVEVDNSAADLLRHFAKGHGLTVAGAPEPELMEPISPWTAL